MLEELKTWDDEVWAKFKRDNYETICLAPQEESLETRLMENK